MIAPRLIIATPHPRNDHVEVDVARAIPDAEILRVRSREELLPERISEFNPDWVFFPHWSWIIGAEIHEQFRCVIFHMTDLPFGRGGSPLQNLIVRGKSDTVLTALRCASAVDAGPIYCKRPLSLEGTAEDILCRASALVPEMIEYLVRHDPAPVEQVGEVVSFQRRKPADGDIGSLGDLDKVFDYIRMLDANDYPPAFLEAGGLRFEFAGASRDGDPATSVNARVIIRRPE